MEKLETSYYICSIIFMSLNCVVSIVIPIVILKFGDKWITDKIIELSNKSNELNKYICNMDSYVNNIHMEMEKFYRKTNVFECKSILTEIESFLTILINIKNAGTYKNDSKIDYYINECDVMKQLIFSEFSKNGYRHDEVSLDEMEKEIEYSNNILTHRTSFEYLSIKNKINSLKKV